MTDENTDDPPKEKKTEPKVNYFDLVIKELK